MQYKKLADEAISLLRTRFSCSRETLLRKANRAVYIAFCLSIALPNITPMQQRQAKRLIEKLQAKSRELRNKAC